MNAITVTNLGKAYKQYPTRWARLAEWILPGKRPRHKLKWVLQDINFVVQPGEAVGIVGINGAGKSTLLKMITGTTQPTTGSVQISGRVAALLELGMGFHPDFSGRQNVLMSGQLMGYSVEEIQSLMSEIEAFAGIGDYIDQPVRVYSSGMQVRLAFSVATARRPEVLIIDEALSVGDAAFQRKCFRRIEAYREEGATLLFVSHDTETVKKLCNNALFLNGGHCVINGKAKNVCDEYERFLFGTTNDSNKRKNAQNKKIPYLIERGQFDPSLSTTCCESIYGNGKADILSCWISDTNDKQVNVIPSGEPFRWCYKVHFNQDVDNPVFAMMLKTKEGIALYGVDSTILSNTPKFVRSGQDLTVSFVLNNILAPGHYYLNCGIRCDTANSTEFLSRRIDSAILKVTGSDGTTVLTGLLDLGATIQIN